MSHFHFVSNEKSKKRLIQMGENKKYIFETGSPDIDIMLSDELPSIESVKKYYNIKYDEYAIFIFHPVTTELHNLEKNIKILINSLKMTKDKFIVIYPNNDLGHEIIMNEYEKLKSSNQFKIFPSLRFEKFLTLLKNAKYIIGNSSAGIMESGIYGIPAINIGNRQKGRYDEKKVLNIQTINFLQDDIIKAINNIEKYRKVNNFFGKGNSSEIIASELLKNSFWNNDVQKVFYDLNLKNIR